MGGERDTRIHTYMKEVDVTWRRRRNDKEKSDEFLASGNTRQDEWVTCNNFMTELEECMVILETD